MYQTRKLATPEGPNYGPSNCLQTTPVGLFNTVFGKLFTKLYQIYNPITNDIFKIVYINFIWANYFTCDNLILDSSKKIYIDITGKRTTSYIITLFWIAKLFFFLKHPWIFGS